MVTREGFEPSIRNHAAFPYLEKDGNYHGHQTISLLILFYPPHPLWHTSLIQWQEQKDSNLYNRFWRPGFCRLNYAPEMVARTGFEPITNRL